jgi:hypothetical protein
MSRKIFEDSYFTRKCNQIENVSQNEKLDADLM